METAVDCLLDCLSDCKIVQNPAFPPLQYNLLLGLKIELLGKLHQWI